MNAKIEKRIKEVLNKRRKDAENFASYNLSLARESEEFCSLEKEKNNIILGIAKAEFENKNCENLKKNLENCEKNIKILLKNLKIASLEPNYTCKLCADTGVYNNKNCRCKNEVMMQILNAESGMNENLPTFESCENLTDVQKLLFIKMQEWATKFPNVKKSNIFITGQIGVGKSYLCSCIANELMKKGFFVYYTTAFNMNKRFLEYCKNGGQDLLENYLDADVLIIDDLGVEPILNNITLNYFYTILNERMLLNKSTIINSNLMPNEVLDRYGERIFSRIMNKKCGLVLEYKGEDRRIKN